MTTFLEYFQTGKQLIYLKYCQLETFKRIKCHSTSNQTQSKKKAIVNVQNTDQKCFQWAILSALHPAVHHIQRVSNYFPFVDESDLTGIEFPMQMTDLVKFGTQNGISVNDFGHEKGSEYPIHLTIKAVFRSSCRSSNDITLLWD